MDTKSAGSGSADIMQPFMTTILAVRHKGEVAAGSDGQVTLGSVAVKQGANKLRRLADGNVIVGFAGATADAMALVDRFEAALKKHSGNLPRAAVELAREWRTDRVLRRLESVLLAVDRESTLLISGSGDVMEPDDGVAGVGSGGPLAVAAARALVAHSGLTAAEIVREAIRIAAGLCIYSNDRIRVENL